MVSRICRSISPLAGLVIGAATTLGVAEGQSLEGFYGQRNITVYIGYSPGGGYDAYGRLLAAHMGNHVPGKPSFVVQNMPGAGSMTLANYLFSVAPSDGTAFGTVAGGVVTAPLFKTQGANFDARDYTWVGSMSGEVGLVVAWHETSFETIEDVMQREFVVGTAGPTSGNHIFPNALNAIVGTKFKLVPGFPGQTEIVLAMERGEVEGIGSWHVSGILQSRPDWLKERKVVPLLQLSLRKHPLEPEVPLVTDLAKDDDERQVLELIFAQQVMGRPFLAPPNLPEDRTQALRTAFNNTMKDTEFLADAEKRRLEINDPMTGEEISELLGRLYQSPPAIVERAAAAVAGS